MATRSWNRVELIGNLTRDPEMRYTPNGAAVASFSIATNRSYTASDGEKKEEVDFHRIVAWAKLAEICSQYLKKGSKVFVSGRLQNRSWEDKDGQSKQTTEIILEDMLMLGGRPGSDSSESYSDTSRPAPAEAVEDVTPPPTEEEAEKPKAEKKKAPEEEPLPKEDPGNLDDLPF